MTADLSVLELFHGPTAAFKDFGARFLAASHAAHAQGRGRRPLNILVATSGDTGGAVAAAFHRRPGIVVSVLFPKGLVSPTQERQLTCWGDNVHSYPRRGTFDDCQRLVKEAFVDAALKQRFELSSANSINLGRLLPQAVYYAATSLAVYRAHGVAPNFMIPERQPRQFRGLRLGAQDRPAHRAHRAGAQCQSRRAGFPGRAAQWQPRASVPTLASAMDVGSPSNMERLRALFPDIEAVRGAVRAESVSDDADPGPDCQRIIVNTRRVRESPGVRTRPPRPRSTRACPSRARGGPLGAGLDRAPGEISRNRGAAHRATNRNAGKPC